MSLDEQARKKRDRKAKSIASSLEQFGDDGIVLIASVDDWMDIEDSLLYCLDHENLSSDEREGLKRIGKRIHEKVKNHQSRQTTAV